MATSNSNASWFQDTLDVLGVNATKSSMSPRPQRISEPTRHRTRPSPRSVVRATDDDDDDSDEPLVLRQVSRKKQPSGCSVTECFSKDASIEEQLRESQEKAQKLEAQLQSLQVELGNSREVQELRFEVESEKFEKSKLQKSYETLQESSESELDDLRQLLEIVVQEKEVLEESILDHSDTVELLAERDETIAELRQQVLEFSKRLTDQQGSRVEQFKAMNAQSLHEDLEKSKLKEKELLDASFTLTNSLHELEKTYDIVEKTLVETKLHLATKEEALQKKETEKNVLEEELKLAKSKIDELTRSKHGTNRQLKHASSIDTEETTPDDDESSNHRTQLKERDDAIASLVEQSVKDATIISQLRQQVSNNEQSETVQKLQREADAYAGQVIELDDEIEQLKAIIVERERQAKEFSDALKNEKQNPNLVALEAEIDELREARATQQAELRTLRKKQWDSQTSSDEMVDLRNEVRTLRLENAELQNKVKGLNEDKESLARSLETVRQSSLTIERDYEAKYETVKRNRDTSVNMLEVQLEKSRKAFAELKESPSHMNPEDMEILQDEIRDLKTAQTSYEKEIESANQTIQELENLLAEKSADAAVAFEEEKEELLAEVESLTAQLEAANTKIQALSEDEHVIGDFKDKLERADEAREEAEKTIIDNYERKLSLLTMNKDVTIDKLRNELVAEKESGAEEMVEVKEQLQAYQVELADVREEMKEQIEAREARIFELEHTLAAQEQLLGSMKTEMDHLQGSMEGTAARRKEEIEEMQQELLTTTATSVKQEREIESLKADVDTKLAEISSLNEKLIELEKAPQEHRDAQDLQMELRVKEVKDRLEKLKWRNTSLKEENINLKERLEQAEALSKPSAYPEEIIELQKKLATSTKRVKKLESELNSYKEPPAASSSTSGIPKSPKRSGKSKISGKPPATPATTVDRKSASPSRRLGLFGRNKK